MPSVWDGRESILEMKNGGSRHWRQMEWMGFYFQFLCERHFDGILSMPGKRYGNTEFDAIGKMCWDFKAHAGNSHSHKIITNATDAVEQTLEEYGYYGLVLAVGKVDYNDEERTFKAWHDELKGERSRYEENRIMQGRASRLRKTEFVLSDIYFVCFDQDTLRCCSGSFQTNMRNSDGRPRKAKVMVDMRKIPDEALIATESFPLTS
ncbi:MAG: hypothetical protein OXH03_11075 [Bacteroidetes bacterium]|nr:hypothetical protein [Bacteroidota bacterium]